MPPVVDLRQKSREFTWAQREMAKTVHVRNYFYNLLSLQSVAFIFVVLSTGSEWGVQTNTRCLLTL